MKADWSLFGAFRHLSAVTDDPRVRPVRFLALKQASKNAVVDKSHSPHFLFERDSQIPVRAS
jgi:hypothetical protein